MFDRFKKQLAMKWLLPDNPGQKLTPNQIENAFQSLLMPVRRRPPKYGTEELLEAYSYMPWLRAVVGKVGQAVGTTQWKAYVAQDPKTGKAIEYGKLERAYTKAQRDAIIKQPNTYTMKELDQHPMLDVLTKGNDRLTGQNIFQMTQNHIDLTGEAFWILERNGLGTPVGIWPIPPTWIRILPTRDDPYYEVRLGYLDISVPITEVIAFYDPNPANPYGRGSGIARAVGDELEADEYAARHIKTFFYNSARPDLIISADKLTKSDTERLEEAWLEKHEGFWNAFKPHFMNRKVDVTEVGQSMGDLQMTQIRKQERDTIIQVFGMPPEKFGILSASNRSTIAASDVFWQRDVIMPRVELIRGVLQKHFVPMFDKKLVLDFESPVVEDADLELNVMRAMPAAFTKNEWRRMANKPSLGEEGEVFIVNPGVTEEPMSGESEKPKDDKNDAQNGENNPNKPESDEGGSGKQYLSAGDADAVVERVRARVLQKIREKEE